MHRKKQVRNEGKRSKGFFINHHHKKLQLINWKTTVIPRYQQVLRDKIMGKNQGSCQQGRGLFRVRLKWPTFGVAAMVKVGAYNRSKLIASSPIGAFVVDGVAHTPSENKKMQE